jgi:hypothetical protein
VPVLSLVAFTCVDSGSSNSWWGFRTVAGEPGWVAYRPGEAIMRRASLTVAALAAPVLSAINVPAEVATTPTNVDVSQRATNESEETVAVNPTNPNNVVIRSPLHEP